MAKIKKKEDVTAVVEAPKVYRIKKGTSVTSQVRGIIDSNTIVTPKDFGINGEQVFENLLKAGHIVEATE